MYRYIKADTDFSEDDLNKICNEIKESYDQKFTNKLKSVCKQFGVDVISSQWSIKYLINFGVKIWFDIIKYRYKNIMVDASSNPIDVFYKNTPITESDFLNITHLRRDNIILPSFSLSFEFNSSLNLTEFKENLQNLVKNFIDTLEEQGKKDKSNRYTKFSSGPWTLSMQGYLDETDEFLVILEHWDEYKAKLSKPKKLTWSSIKSQIEEESEDGIDSIYEGTDAGSYISTIMEDVENSLHLFVEPSVEGGMGTYLITSTQGEDFAVEVDFIEYNDEALNLALESKNKTEFKNKFKSYVQSLIL